MNIGLLGFGVVGRGVYEITNSREDMQVRKVLCLEDINLPDAESVKDIKLIVEDPSRQAFQSKPGRESGIYKPPSGARPSRTAWALSTADKSLRVE